MQGFELKYQNGVGYYSIKGFEDTGRVKTCFSTRTGGVSTGGYTSLNLGFSSGDDRSNVIRNIEILCSSAGFKMDDMVISDQVHGDRCRIVGAADRGKGVIGESDIKGVDALITVDRDVCICIFTADCVPVFLLDDERGVIALCHGGWRGIIGGIIPKTINKMAESFKSSPDGIKAAIGPSIGPCCFEVGEDVRKKFEEEFEDDCGVIIDNGTKHNINLWKAAYLQLKNAGLNENNIINSNICTCCRSGMFYSYRRDGACTGRMISMMKLI